MAIARNRFAVVIAAVALGSLVLGCGSAATTVPAHATTVRLEPRFGLGFAYSAFVDTSRPSDQSTPAGAHRTVAFYLLYPAARAVTGSPRKNARPLTGAGRFPLIVFGHGHMSLPADYRALLRALAAQGYVVVAPLADLPPGAPDVTGTQFAQFPVDVSFLISRMSTRAPDGLAAVVDPTKVGIAGHSLGADIMLRVGFNRCCIDRRVRAAAILSGVETTVTATTPYFASPAEPPVLFVQGDQDQQFGPGTAIGGPQGAAAGLYAAAHPPKYYLSIVGADHLTPYVGDTATAPIELTALAVVDFFNHYLKDAPDRLHQDAAASPGLGRLQAAP